MIKRINRTEEIEAKLLKDGKITYLDSPKDLQVIKKMNHEMEEVQRDCITKLAKSAKSARDTIFTA